MDPVTSRKRKHDSEDDSNCKRVKVTAQVTPTVDPRRKQNTQATQQQAALPAKSLTDPRSGQPAEKEKSTQSAKKSEKRKIIKLAPKRPFPTVPTSVSATGPSSAHQEGKNYICVTRKTQLATYMRRCKDVIMKDGYKTLHLCAMGAAIPLLLQLTMALPPILPYAKEEIHLNVITSTVDVHDEVVPEDEDEDITYQTRSKSALHVTMTIGDGEYEGGKNGGKSAKRRPGAGRFAGGTDGKRTGSGSVVMQEPEQEDLEML